ncbi:MAG TPA: DUF2061 domain-containing protein [Vicinamibacteria bacterium]|nr:DUF2061 domain-containing protein [Vicinamibacteria bacterium]
MDTHLRSVVKAMSYRVVATLVTSLLAFMFTDDLLIAVGIGSAEGLSKIFLFWIHERMWVRVRWGRAVPMNSP